MLIGLINKSLAIYGHHAPPALQLKKWRAGETVWDGFMRMGRPCLEFSCKEVKVAWANCRRYFSELLRSSRFCSSLSTAFSPPSQMETVAPLVSVNGVHNCSAWLRGFLVCKQLSKPWLLFYLRFPGLLFRRRRTLTTPYHNPATKQCPVHVCQMYLPLSLSWSIFQWLLSLSWLRWIQPRQRFCPEQSEFTVILGAFYRLQEEMIKHTKVESMLDRSQIFTTAVKSKLQIGIRGIIWKNACRKSKQHFILMACWTIE